MSIGSKIARVAVLIFSLTLLSWYVVYSQQAAQVSAPPAVETPELPQPKIPAAAGDPIARLAAFHSHNHWLQPAIAEESVPSSPLARPTDLVWEPAMISRILNDRGFGASSSSRMLTPKKFAFRYFRSVAEDRQSRRQILMAGSKSAQVFTPDPSRISPREVLTTLLPEDAETLVTEPPFEGDRMESALVLVGDKGMPVEPFLNRPRNSMEDPQNIRRILADNGRHFNESESIIAPAKIAEARRYEKNPVYTSSCIDKKPLKGPVSDFLWPLFRLLMPLTIDEPTHLPLPQDFRLWQNEPLLRPSL